MTSLDRLENTQKPTAKVENPYEVKNLDHLGLIAAQFDALGLVERIDTMVPQCSEKRKVSIGQAVKAMVINGLGFANHTLYLMPAFAASQGERTRGLVVPGRRRYNGKPNIYEAPEGI